MAGVLRDLFIISETHLLAELLVSLTRNLSKKSYRHTVEIGLASFTCCAGLENSQTRLPYFFVMRLFICTYAFVVLLHPFPYM